MAGFSFRVLLFLVLTIVTQIGGIAYLAALMMRRRVLAFLCFYLALSVSAIWVAPLTGRVALSCFDQGALQMQSWVYCATNRSYVSPELKEVLEDTAQAMEAQFPGTVTQVLDGNFPFLVGFPLLPHLSHDDGEKVDLAFYYADDTGYRSGVTKSPIGYFAFEPGSTTCPKVWPSLRWDFAALQGMWPDLALDIGRNRAVLQILAEDPRVGKIYVEPHLQKTLGVAHAKIRFQGCRAARHDDHIHFQL